MVWQPGTLRSCGVATYLDAIIAHHRRRAGQDSRSTDTLVEQAAGLERPRGFRDALGGGDELAVISEIKRRSPSRGDLAVDLDPAAMAATYERAGARCLSVLTDEPHFAGSFDDLASARSAVSLPVLRKDFTVCANDVLDARLMGADAVLLIVAALDDVELRDFSDLAFEIGLDALVEVHDEAELERAMVSGHGRLIGVNQRDLETFEVDRDRAVRVAAALGPDTVKVAESGVRGVSDARELAAAGYDAVLVGEHLVTAVDPAEAVAELRVPRR